MHTDEILQRELSETFHAEADPVARMASPPAALLRQAVRYRRRRVAIRAGGLTAAAATAAAAVLASGALSPAPDRASTATQSPPAGRHQTGPATSPASGGPAGTLLAAEVASAPSATAAASGMPGFYLAADDRRPDLGIHDAVTGNLLSTVPLPAAAEPKLTHVTAAGDDRTFVVGVFTLSAGTRFYELKITANGQPGGLAALPVPAVPAAEGVNAIALSPDGTRLAVAIQKVGTRGGDPAVVAGIIDVVNLATGAVRTWTASGDAFIRDLTWDTSGRQLAYFNSGTSNRSSGLWRLDTGAPGRALLSGQRLLPQADGPDAVQDALLTPDGRHIIASVIRNSLSDVTTDTIVGGVVQVSAQGRPLQVLLPQRATLTANSDVAATACLLESADTTGDHLLVSCVGNGFGRLDRGRFTALPSAGGAAW